MPKIKVLVCYYPQNVRYLLQEALKSKGIDANIEDWDEVRADQEATTTLSVPKNKTEEAKEVVKKWADSRRYEISIYG